MIRREADAVSRGRRELTSLPDLGPQTVLSDGMMLVKIQLT